MFSFKVFQDAIKHYIINNKAIKLFKILDSNLYIVI